MIYFYLSKFFINFIKNQINKILLKDFLQLSNDINSIFNNVNIDITKLIFYNLKIKNRNNKLTFVDVLNYIFNYSFINTTKQQIVSDYNFINNTNYNRSSFYKKELNIPIIFYQNLFIKVKNLLDKIMNKNLNLYNVIAVDGTYSNTNLHNEHKLETCLNMGYFDCTNQIPIDLEIKGTEYNNKEIESFINYINKNKLDINNLILVLDRAYYSYDLINFLDSKKLNYVIRIKNNSIGINNKNKANDKLINKNTRIINYKSIININKKDKNNNIVKLEQTLICNLITNLNKDKFNDDKIKNLYLQRWDIEVFFKLLKSNFKFGLLREHNKKTLEQYKKKYLIILINLHLIRLIEFVYSKHQTKNYKNKSKNKHQYNFNNNNSLLITGFKNLINPIINGKLTNNLIFNYCNSYVIKTNTIKNISNPRTSYIPFSKWYVKSYSDYYKYSKIIEAKNNNNLDSLNKNLKLLANELTIIT